VNERVSEQAAEDMANEILGEPKINHASRVYCFPRFEMHALVSWAHPAAECRTTYQYIAPKRVVASGKKIP